MRYTTPIILFFSILFIGGNFIFFQNQQKKLTAVRNSLLKFEQRLETVEQLFSRAEGKTAERSKHIDELEKKLKETEKKVDENKIIKSMPQEQSREELLTTAVARVTPAVVSIVVTKDVPQLEVVYINPFGDDPFFHDFGVRIPTYRQKGTQEKRVGAGTGFLVSSDGHIVTNRHVVEDRQASYTVLLSTGSQKKAAILYRDQKHDVAVLKIEGNDYPNVEFGDSENLKLGQTVIAIGNALGEYSNSVSTGIISGLNRTVQAAGSRGQLETLHGVLQTDAAINPGNSGGPLLNMKGQAIGVNVATVLGSNNISFSIPIHTIRGMIKEHL